MPAADWNESTLVMLLAGGQGERLYPLTRKRAKPAVPFAGRYRIVDFTLSNCLNSGLKRIYVLTQHHSLSLDRHLRAAWSILHPELGEFIQTVPPQRQLVSRWYAGTADAVFQNLYLLDEERPQYVLVVSGDQVYRMDYGPLLAFHVARDADLTIACTQIPRAEATRAGVLEVDDEARLNAFTEKPEYPVPLPHRPSRSLANMGVYVFRTEALVRALIADAKEASEHDFGRSIIPAMLRHRRVYAFDITERCPPGRRYWQDVGTLDSYFDATMELLAPEPSFELYDPAWPVRTHGGRHPPAVIRDAGPHEGCVASSIVSPGCVIAGGRVARSVLSPQVRVGAGATVEEAILLPGVAVGEGAALRRVIVDEGVAVPPGARIGHDPETDRRRFVVTDAGVAVVPEGTLIA